jgi:hypothetical protein
LDRSKNGIVGSNPGLFCDAVYRYSHPSSRAVRLSEGFTESRQVISRYNLLCGNWNVIPVFTAYNWAILSQSINPHTFTSYHLISTPVYSLWDHWILSIYPAALWLWRWFSL